MTGLTEADTCRKFVLPKLIDAGWDREPHSFTEQRTFTDGRIIVSGGKIRRGQQKRADYLLRYTRDFPIAVVEAKPNYKSAGDGVQQAKEYAQILGLNFAYATNGTDIIEVDFLTGKERGLNTFPGPDDLWNRQRGNQGLTDAQSDRLLTASYLEADRRPRYYQEIAINRAVQAIVQGKKRVLLTMATGTGKTLVAFQICWKLWSSRWNRSGQYRRPKILYLADRNILVDDPKDKTFTPFGEARHKIENGEVVKSREMYFALYQSLAKDERRPGLYREYDPAFFDLIIVDECHRGSASDESNWREILEYFEPAHQLGMTATPLRQDNRDTYKYFGNPIYTYSLRDGIADGFLAPYRVHRVVTTVDAAGWRPSKGELDRYGREIPDEEYHTKDFERIVALRARTEAIARHITGFLKKSGDRFGKTLVFCVGQEHAEEMRHALNNLNADLVKENPDYVCRVTADEGTIGRGHLSRFQELETLTPAILTSSKLLTTGVDAPMVKNVALARVVGSITEFKQIIGRGTRVRDDYGKYYFNILDYTGTATKHFADPDFDGDPVLVTEEIIDEEGQTTEVKVVQPEEPIETPEKETVDEQPQIKEPPAEEWRRKFYVDNGSVEIAAQLVYELDADGKQLRVVKYTDYTADKVRTLYPTAAELRKHWANPIDRKEIIEGLSERGIEFEELMRQTNKPEADPFDLLCHVAFNAPLRTRRERADRLRKDRKDFFDKYAPEAKAVLEDLLDKYTEYGIAEFTLPDVLKGPPISNRGNVGEIIQLFGSPHILRDAVTELQQQLYAA